MQKHLFIKKEQGKVGQTPIPPLFLLLVDDIESNRIVARMALEKRKHKVTEAHDGLQALNLLVKHDFDAVLMDVQMPVMDGLTATRIIRAAECGDQIEGVEKGLAIQLCTRLSASHITIVALTANVTSEARGECFAAGMDDFLAKPFDLATFAAVFSKVAIGHFTS